MLQPSHNGEPASTVGSTDRSAPRRADLGGGGTARHTPNSTPDPGQERLCAGPNIVVTNQVRILDCLRSEDLRANPVSQVAAPREFEEEFIVS
jgi:hypothetical protein